MKPKDNCNSCGRYLRKNKLTKDPKDKTRLLCIRCFKKEDKNYVFSRNEKPIIPGGKEVVKKKVIFYKRQILLRGEEEVLKQKYGYTKFRTGRSCKEVARLKKGIIKKKKINEEIKSPDNIDNKEFIEGLKKKDLNSLSSLNK